jgi:hypothetical protein
MGQRPDRRRAGSRLRVRALHRSGGMIREITKGKLAGFAGTLAVTMALRHVFPRILPPPARRGFLPQELVLGLERRLPARLRGRQRRPVTMLLHYVYGTGAGGFYGLAMTRLHGAPPLLTGAWFGVAVWAGSRHAWLPGPGILPATTDRPPQHRLVPIAAHLLYGIATAYAYEALSTEPVGAALPRRRRRGR